MDLLGMHYWSPVDRKTFKNKDQNNILFEFDVAVYLHICDFSCSTSIRFKINALSQREHLWGFSPVNNRK